MPLEVFASTLMRYMSKRFTTNVKDIPKLEDDKKRILIGHYEFDKTPQLTENNFDSAVVDHYAETNVSFLPQKSRDVSTGERILSFNTANSLLEVRRTFMNGKIKIAIFEYPGMRF